MFCLQYCLSLSLPSTSYFEACIEKSVILVLLRIANPLLVCSTKESCCLSSFETWLEKILKNSNRKKKLLSYSSTWHQKFEEAVQNKIQGSPFELVKSVMMKPGNEFLTRTLEIRRQAVQKQKKTRKNKSLKQQVIPRTLAVSSQNSILLQCLNEINVDPQTFQENEDMHLLHLVLSKKVCHEFPLEALRHLRSNSDACCCYDIPLSDAKALCWFAKKLPPQQKKYMKLVLLMYKKMCGLKVQYCVFPSDRLKCMQAAETSKDHIRKCSIVLCTHCMEILTFWGEKKRPQSFGYFLDTERLEHRCYRDDNNNLMMLPLFDPNNHSTLQVSQNQKTILLCQGGRTCFEIVCRRNSATSFGGMYEICSKCSARLECGEKNIHLGTCLSQPGLEKACSTCRFIVENDPEVLSRLLAIKKQEEEKASACAASNELLVEMKEARRRKAFRKLLQWETDKHNFKKLLKKQKQKNV